MHWTLVTALWLCTGCEISDMALSVSALVVASPAPSCRKPTVSCCVLFMLGFFFFYGGFVRGRKISLRVDLWSLPPYIESQNHSTQQSARAGLLRAAAASDPTCDHQFGVHLSHKITPLPPIENFSTVIGLSIVLSSCAATPPNSLRRAMALSGRLHSPPKSLTPDSQPV